jgi:hypothetical protein
VLRTRMAPGGCSRTADAVADIEGDGRGQSPPTCQTLGWVAFLGAHPAYVSGLHACDGTVSGALGPRLRSPFQFKKSNAIEANRHLNVLSAVNESRSEVEFDITAAEISQ